MLITLKRIFKSGWLNFRRDGGIALATVFILFMAVFLVSGLFLLRDASQFLISNIQEKVDISVYFKESSAEEEVLQVGEEISKIPEVKEIEYVSKEMALETFIERYRDDSLLMEALIEVGVNPFLATLNIKAWEAGQYEKIAEFLGGTSFENLIEKVDYYERKPVIERLSSLTAFAQRTGILISIVLIIVAVLVTFNTIRLAILNSCEEIKVQRIVGASNWFIRGPFLVQGAIAGVFATLISLFVFSLICWILAPKIEVLFPGLNLFNFLVKNLKFLIPLQLFTGISLGVISSLIAVRKYLKV